MNEKRIFKGVFFILLPMFLLVLALENYNMTTLANCIHFIMVLVFLFYYFNAWKFFLSKINKYFKKQKQ